MSLVNNVAAGKPAVGGALSVAPAGTTLPTDATTALAGAFTNLGYISSDGVTKTITRETEEIKAWGGDTVHTPLTSFGEAFQLKLIEYLNPDVRKVAYGDDNVTGTLANGITTTIKAVDLVEKVYALDMIVNGAIERIVIPRGKVTAVGDTVYVDNDVAGYDITITALPDSTGNYSYEYTKQS